MPRLGCDKVWLVTPWSLAEAARRPAQSGTQFVTVKMVVLELYWSNSVIATGRWLLMLSSSV